MLKFVLTRPEHTTVQKRNRKALIINMRFYWIYDEFRILLCCTQPFHNIPFTFKRMDIESENPNYLSHIAAHLQGALSQHTKANLAKELQLPTHSKQSLGGHKSPWT